VKFLKRIYQALEQTSLKKVRLRTDPLDKHDLATTDTYEGYVIEESEGMLRVMVVAPDNQPDMLELSPDDLEPASGKTFDEFKEFSLKYLHDRSRCDHAETTTQNILRAGDIQHLEAFLKEQGVEHDEFVKMIKLFLMT
jgi:hypothetical protein